MAEGFVTDTHPLLYYFQGGGTKLSRKAKRLFDKTIVERSCIIHIPAPVLWEILLLLERNRIALSLPFSDWVDGLLNDNPMLILQPFDEIIIKHCQGLTRQFDPFDTAIIATTINNNASLITNDALIHQKHPCKLYWD